MLRFLEGPGAVRTLMRACDWRATPLGMPADWPPSLQTVVRVMLTSRFAMWLAWGPELTFLCNDAYLPTVGMKRDWVIGSRSDRVWAEIWPDIGPRIQHVLASGEATWDEALLLYLERSGFAEETYHTFSYSPLAGDRGETAGMLCVVAEVTERVIGERQLAFLRDLGQRLAPVNTRAGVMAALEGCLAANGHDLPFALAYLREDGGDPSQLMRVALHGCAADSPAAPARLVRDDAGAPWPADVAPDEERLIDVPPALVAGLPLRHWQRPPHQALVLAINGSEDDAPAGFLVAGLNPHRPFDAEYRGFLELLAGQIAAAVARADQYERERARAAALAELDRAKTAFFSNVSHEFRTPLTLMLGPLEDALAEYETPPPGIDLALAARQSDRMNLAHRNALRLLRLVNTLLDFSRIESGRAQAVFRPTDIASLTAELASSFRSTVERAGLRLKVATEPLSSPVYVDRDMWEKVVLNLVSNAFKFTFEGEIEVRLTERDGSAVLAVHDTGTGIAADQLPRLFERFHRVEGARGRSFEGSGIGLALVSELVRLHGGAIEVASEPGVGSTFTVRLPMGCAHLPADRIGAALDEASPTDPGAGRARSFVEEAMRWLPQSSDAANAADWQMLDDVHGEPWAAWPASPTDVQGAQALGSAPLPEGSGSPGAAALSGATGSPDAAASSLQAGSTTGRRVQRILLADDNADLRGYIGRLLVSRGYEVHSVGDGQAALSVLQNERPDLLITDVMMPVLDGFALLRAVRSHPSLRDLPVIMLSARAGEEAKVEGLDAGADDYLIKPFAARELLARVAAQIGMARIRREAAAAVQASETVAREQAERVQLALDAGAIIGTWVWEVPADRFIADERFARSFGLDPQACHDGLRLAQVIESIHPEDRSRVISIVDRALRQGGTSRCEYRVHAVDEEWRWVEAVGRVDLGADGAAVRFPGVLIDVHHRRSIEDALRRMNDELEQRVSKAIAERERVEEALRQAQKMEAVGQLTGGIAHDFNNLLTIITGNVGISRRALNAGETTRAGRALDHAQRGAERAAALTQRLLAFSRRQPLAPKPVDIDRLVSGMADLLNRSLGEMVQLEIASSPGLWLTEVDPNQLESAIVNLAVNARDAMPQGGKLTIETANARLDEQYSTTHAEVAPGSYVMLAVTDTGHGMSRDVLARAFDPFFTTKEIGKGTGLGLSMVYGFVKQSGGHVKIYSEPGQGTTVKIYLPRLMSGPLEEVDEAPLEVDRSRGEQRILVVEDDDDVRAYTVEILRELGYRVLEAHDGPTALRLLARPEQIVDLLFTDIVMPGMSGRELADAARELRPGLKVLYTSGYTRNAIVHGGRLDPGVEMIAKPFTYQALADKIADVLDLGRSGRMLVVEEDPTVRMLTVEALQGAGYAVEQAANAAEALGRVRAAGGRYDAVLVDMALPDKPADALAVELRATFADLPLLLVSAGRLDELRERFAHDPRIGVIAKPFNAARLQTALAHLGVRRTS